MTAPTKTAPAVWLWAVVLLSLSTFAPAYPLLLLFIFAALWDAATARLPAIRSPKPPSGRKGTKNHLASTPQIG